MLRYNEIMATKPVVFIFTTAYAPFVGGAELAVQEITRRLKDNFEFIIITARLKRSLAKQEQVPEGAIYRVGFGLGVWDKLLLPFLGARRAWFMMRGKKEVILWSIMISYASIAAFLLKLFYPKIPFMLTLQEGNREWDRGLSKWWWTILLRFTKIDRVTAISDFLKDRAREAGYKGPISVVPNGVDEKLLEITSHGSSTSDDSPQGGATSDVFPPRFIIFSASRLVYKNGIDILLEAAARLKDEFDFQIILAGDGPEQKKLKLLTHHLSLITRVKFLGHVPYEQLPELYQQADIFVRPSRSEGLGSAFLEAMAAGCITIGTPVGGIPDFLIDGKTGFLAHPDDADDLARVLRKAFLMSNDKRNAMIESARALVRERFLWRQIAEEMKNIFMSHL